MKARSCRLNSELSLAAPTAAVRAFAARLPAIGALSIGLLAFGVATPDVARAGNGCNGIPGPFLSTVPIPIPVAPDGSLIYAVRIVCPNGPVVNSRVNLLFNTVGDSLVCWCATNPFISGTPHSFFANTNANGYAFFNLAAGGCIEYNLAAIPGDKNFAAEVFADFVKMQECGVVSPDAVDNAGRVSTDTPVWNPAGLCGVGLSDGVRHTTPLATSGYQWCTDMNGDRAVTLSDGVILTPYLANAVSCAGNAGF